MAKKTNTDPKNQDTQMPPPSMANSQNKAHLAAMPQAQKRMRQQLGKNTA